MDTTQSGRFVNSCTSGEQVRACITIQRRVRPTQGGTGDTGLGVTQSRILIGFWIERVWICVI